ncbi:MAG: hypothetical protein JWL77_2937 [Chthonomonadaceae bacterium]|nr:hypothetical protein [Chthonomonadaceae bacterium]
MRHSGLWAIFAVGTVLFSVGCGGGGGGGNSTSSVSGVWTGTLKQVITGMNTGTIHVAFFQNGTQITGTAIGTIAGAGSSPVGTITGSIDGNRIVASITTQIPPTGSATTQRTEQTHGFGAPNWYSTNAPVDLSKPIGVTVDGNIVPQAPNGSASPGPAGTYWVDMTRLYTNRFYLNIAVPSTSIVQIQYDPVDLGPDSGSMIDFNGTVYGNSITGVYSTLGNSPGRASARPSRDITGTTTASGSTEGTFVLTKLAGVTTPDLATTARTWSGTYTTSGVTHTLSIQFTQTQDTLSFFGTTGLSGSSGANSGITGFGAIIGNNVALVATSGSVTTYLTGVYATSTVKGIAVSGTTTDSTGGSGTFEIESDVISAQSLRGK